MTEISESKLQQAKVLAEALPYIKKFYGQTIVIKYGGAAMEDPNLCSQVASDIALLKFVGINVIVVHGGGKEINKWVEKVGITPKFIEGLRYTDETTLEITEMVLTGKINSNIVSLINHHGGKAVGISGKDAGLYNLKKIKSSQGEDLGFVGELENTNPQLLFHLSEKGYIPVISSFSEDSQGQSLNVNADTVASGIAQSLKALKLIYLSDVQGINKEGKLISSLNIAEAKDLLRHPDIKGGMIPKLQNAIFALENGVKQIHMINGTISHAVLLEIFTDVGIGTMIYTE